MFGLAAYLSDLRMYVHKLKATFQPQPTAVIRYQIRGLMRVMCPILRPGRASFLP
jgi:hypothetical protein